jgi:hypothetical protein
MKALLARLLGTSKDLLEKLKIISRETFVFCWPFMLTAFKSGAVLLIPVAMEVVKSLEGVHTMRGAEKFEAAVEALKTEAIKRGQMFPSEVLGGIVQHAVINLREGGK